MNTNAVNISFQKDLLKQIDKIAKDESRSRSELIREAARMYIEKKKRWEKIFSFGDSVQNQAGITVESLDQEIHKLRNSKKK